jgi:hypothetical protein
LAAGAFAVKTIDAKLKIFFFGFSRIAVVMPGVKGLAKPGRP